MLVDTGLFDTTAQLLTGGFPGLILTAVIIACSHYRREPPTLHAKVLGFWSSTDGCSPLHRRTAMLRYWHFVDALRTGAESVRTFTEDQGVPRFKTRDRGLAASGSTDPVGVRRAGRGTSNRAGGADSSGREPRVNVVSSGHRLARPIARRSAERRTAVLRLRQRRDLHREIVSGFHCGPPRVKHIAGRRNCPVRLAIAPAPTSRDRSGTQRTPGRYVGGHGRTLA